MNVSIASDHAGFEIKKSLIEYLSSQGHEAIDMGPLTGDRSDYPDYAKKVAASVQAGECERGVLICGSGMGMCISANRFAKIRAAVLHDEFDAEFSRAHNNANIACFGARKSDISSITKLLDIFMNTGFEGGRHAGRVAKIEL